MTIGVVMGGIQLIPSADAAAHSIRLMLSREFALTYSLHPLNLVQLWSPYVFAGGAYGPLDYPWFHELGIYSGAILPVQGAVQRWIWCRRHGRERFSNTVSSHVRSWNTRCRSWMLSRTA